MRLDDFDEYLRAKREELRLTPPLFWLDFALALACWMGLVALVVAFTLAAPVIRDFFMHRFG